MSETARSGCHGSPATQMGLSISHCYHLMDAELGYRRILACTSQMVNEVEHFDPLSFHVFFFVIFKAYFQISALNLARENVCDLLFSCVYLEIRKLNNIDMK